MNATERLGEGVTFGINIGAPFADRMPDPRWLCDLVEEIEALGFDAMWVSDHILLHKDVHDSLVFLSAFAARTTRIVLGTSVLLLPLRHPTVVAKSVSILDHLSNGRIVLGVGVGGEFAEEFEACGVPLKERGARADEALEVLRRLWTEESVTHEGRFYPFRDANMLPRPVQPGGPAIWVGGRSDAALQRTARFGRAWLSYLQSPDRVAAGMETVRGLARDNGRTPEDIFSAILQFVCLDDSREKARTTALHEMNRGYRTNFEKVFDRYVPHGPPDDIAENVTRYQEAGVRHFIFRLACPSDRIPAQVRRIAGEVIPRFRTSR